MISRSADDCLSYSTNFLDLLVVYPRLTFVFVLVPLLLAVAAGSVILSAVFRLKEGEFWIRQEGGGTCGDSLEALGGEDSYDGSRI